LHAVEAKEDEFLIMESDGYGICSLTNEGTTLSSPHHPISHATKNSRLTKRVGAIIREGTSDTRLILISTNLKKVREK